jgi:hypothetical protein
VKAVSGTSSAEASLSVAPLQIAGLVHTLGSTIAGGSYSIIKMQLNGPAPAEGAQIAVASSNPAIVPVPASLAVNPGYAYTNIKALTQSVVSKTPVTITASLFDQSMSTVVTVRPARLSYFYPSPTAVRSGETAVVSVSVDGTAPSGGFTVTLSSDSVLAPVPAQVVIPAGAQSTTVSVVAGTVTAPTTVTLQATAGAVIKTATLTINP